jgi:predicted RNase H-like HicB family nuclease
MVLMNVPEGFLRSGERIEDLVDMEDDVLAVDFGWIEGYRVIYERLPRNWAAYSPDLAGVISTAKSRRGIERMMQEAIPFHLRGLAEDRAERPWLYRDSAAV